MDAATSRPSNEPNEEGIASQFQKHRADIIRYLPVSITKLVIKGIASHLIDPEDMDFYLNQNNSREDKIHKLLTTVEQKSSGYSKFLQCIHELSDHMGHPYIAALLEDKHFQIANKEEIAESAMIRTRIYENLCKLMDINLSEIGRVLTSKGLLTLDEYEWLTENVQPRDDKILHLFHILDTKGPIAHTRFVHCLREEDSDSCHKELVELLDPEEFSTQARKRAREDSEPPAKRLPKNLEMHGDLKTEEYAEIVRTWRGWVSNGQWCETEKAECKCMQQQEGQKLVVTVASLLQSVIARIVRKEYAEGKILLKMCDLLCTKVKGDNNTFLRGRCKYTWSWLYRYLKKLKKAKKCATAAMAILGNVESGEDKALANYGYACAIIDYNANAKVPDQGELKSAESALQFAIVHARIADRGLEHIAPHSHLRLAQMYLGSTHYEPGKNTDPENIRKASECLKAIDLESIPPRSRCMFYLTESDLYRCKGNINIARESAKCALRMAEENCFETEITSAKTKLESLL